MYLDNKGNKNLTYLWRIGNLLTITLITFKSVLSKNLNGKSNIININPEITDPNISEIRPFVRYVIKYKTDIEIITEISILNMLATGNVTSMNFLV